MKSVLPKLLFLRLVEKGKVADMVHKDVAEDGELRVDRGDFAEGTAERGSKALKGGGRVELCNLKVDLLGNELALKV